MLTKEMEKALNGQITIEAESSQVYLAMASWAETQGMEGVAEFMYMHSDEERMHMMKLVRFVNDRGGKTQLKEVEVPPQQYKSVLDIFTQIKEHEEYITSSINNLYGVTVDERDYTTGNFLQWYITEQIEEESLFNTILDKIQLVGADKAGMFHIDKELDGMTTGTAAPAE